MVGLSRVGVGVTIVGGPGSEFSAGVGGGGQSNEVVGAATVA